MPKYNYHQSAFKNGMISKKLYGRTDIEEYGYSVKDLKNFLPASMGGVFSRPGTVTQQTLDLNSSVFVWERVSGSLYIKYSKKPLSGTDCPFEVFDSTWAPYLTNFSTQALTNRGSAVTIGTHVALIKHQTYDLESLEDLDLQGFSYIQAEDYFILTHNSGEIPPLVFYSPSLYIARVEHYQFSSRTSVSSDQGSSFGSGSIVLGNKGTPYLINKNTGVWLLPSGFAMGTAGSQATSNVTGIITAYASSSGSTTPFFTEDMVNTFFIIKQGDKEGVYWIDSLVSPSVVNIRVMYYGLDVTTRSYEWRRQLFARDLGFPKLVYTFNNRSVFLNTAKKPNWVFCSKTNDLREIWGMKLFQFLTTDPITEASSFEFALNSKDSSEIRWVSQQNDLLIGTAKEEFVINQGEDALSIVNIGIASQSNIGGSFVEPVKNSEAVFFVSADGKSIRQIQYNFDVRGYRSKNISILNDDLIFKLRSGQTYKSLASIRIIQLAWQESNRTLWILTNAGNLLSVTLEPSSSTVAWAYHEVGDAQEINYIFSFFSNGLERSVLGMVTNRNYSYYIDFVAPEYLNTSIEIESLNIGDQPVFMDGCCLIATEDSPIPILGGFYSATVGIGYQFRTDPAGFAQRYPTGKEFIISDYSKLFGSDPDDPTLFDGEIVYLINNYKGYGVPSFFIALTREDALAGNAYTPLYPYNISLTDTEPAVKYTKWGTFTTLIGETVDVIADGILREGLIVDADGIVTLPIAASKVTVGLRFDSRLETITPEASNSQGSSQGSLMRARKAYVRYYNTRTASIGSREGNLEPVVFPEVPYTGVISTFIDSDTSKEYSIIIKKEKSLPLNVMNVTFRGEVE